MPVSSVKAVCWFKFDGCSCSVSPADVGVVKLPHNSGQEGAHQSELLPPGSKSVAIADHSAQLQQQETNTGVGHNLQLVVR